MSETKRSVKTSILEHKNKNKEEKDRIENLQCYLQIFCYFYRNNYNFVLLNFFFFFS